MKALFQFKPKRIKFKNSDIMIKLLVPYFSYGVNIFDQRAIALYADTSISYYSLKEKEYNSKIYEFRVLGFGLELSHTTYSK